MNIEIYKMTVNDLNEIKDNLLTDFDDFWNYNILNSELESDNSKYLVAKIKKQIVGFSGIKILIDEAELMNIVIRKDLRNKNIGTFLLKNIISLCKSLHLTKINLEVNETNATAIKLYESLHFEKVGLRKNYYKENNALLFSLNLKQEKS